MGIGMWGGQENGNAKKVDVGECFSYSNFHPPKMGYNTQLPMLLVPLPQKYHTSLKYELHL